MPLVLPTSFFNAHYKFSLASSDKSMSFALAGQLNTGVDPDDFAEALRADFASPSGYDTDNMYAQWTFEGVKVEINTGAGIAAGESIVPIAGGGGGAETNPPQCCVIVKKLTGLASRRERGRMYFPPISLADADVNDNGTIDPTPLGVITTNIDNWLAETLLVTSEIDAYFLLHEQATVGPGTPTAISAFVVEDTIATQRRRLR